MFATPPEGGVSETLARERASVIRDLRYEIALIIPRERREPVQGRVTLRFVLSSPQRVVLDFAPPRAHVRTVRAGGRVVGCTFENGHITLPPEALRVGGNEVALEFIAGDDSLNRTDDLLYTLFVPARAHLAFPCFDQPNLKARYTLSLDLPADWEAVANGALVRAERGAGRTCVHFAETQPLPTYLFSFVAGKFSVETATRDGRDFRMFHRETNAARLVRNRDSMFDLHAGAVAWLEAYTGIPYPWGKFDFVMIPGFQFTGMEHPGAILYSSTLLLDETATQLQLLSRASTIAHETTHLWFGDLVTMEWFSDVWMKEAFANFLASKIVDPWFPEVDHELRFLLGHYPAAYQIDRTAGANPIRQPLENLLEAGQLYGEIIYHKAPIVMRQLERMMGEAPFREGVREFSRRYAFGNATWFDLVALLDARTTTDLVAWSRTWVEERGRPRFTTMRSEDAGAVSKLTLEQDDPLGRGLVWPQQVTVTLGYPGSVEHVPLEVNGRSVVARGATGRPRPLYVLPNGGGLGYGLFVLDPASHRYLLDHLEHVPDALTRGSAWVTLWDNLLESLVTPGALVDLILRALPKEPDEQIRQRVLLYLVRAYWGHLSPPERMALAPAIEATLRAGISQATTSSQKSAFFNAFRDVVSTSDGTLWLERVWRRDEHVPGLSFAEDDEIAMALELAVRGLPGRRELLETQLERTENPDRRSRLAFVTPALSPDPARREEAFEQFRHPENRRREPWVLESLAYLNHPLREAHAVRFVRPSLELLREIQRTGDIFFPKRWVAATLSGHRSPEAAAIVRDFLDADPRYPQWLRWTILAAADELFRVTGSSCEGSRVGDDVR